jgi:hypothetical protein
MCLRKDKYGKGDEVHVAMFQGHFFPVKETVWAKSAIKLYSRVKDMENRENVAKIRANGKPWYDESKPRANTLLVVKTLYDQGFFERGNMVECAETAHTASIRDDIDLSNIENEQKQIEWKLDDDKLEDIKTSYTNQMAEHGDAVRTARAQHMASDIFYCDTETFTNNGDHQLFLLGALRHDKADEGDVVIWQVSEACGAQETVNKWLSWMDRQVRVAYNEGEENDENKKEKREIKVYFHNLKYDLAVLQKYLPLVRSPIIKDNSVYSVQLKHYGRVFHLNCSFKVVPIALRKFAKTFDLPSNLKKQEAIAYSYYTPETAAMDEVEASVYRDFLPESERSKFDDIITTVPSYNGTTFDAVEYYRFYLKYDCLVLRAGFIKFDEAIREITYGMVSAYDCLTISSLTDKYAKMCGAYDGVYQVKGNLREYIGRAVYGGRVHVNTRYKKKLLTGRPIADYDGVSLYPSAIARLCAESGFPEGAATRLTELNTWREKGYCILTVQISAVNKNQQMPFIAHRGDGSIDYLNEAPAHPIVIDKTTLEDYIEFHDVEYEVLDGVYWDGGFNTRMGGVIETLFNKRLEAKDAGKEALQQTLKLMMNASYGKTVLKKSKTSLSYVNRKTTDKDGNEVNFLEKYIDKFFHLIKNIRVISDNLVEVERISIDDSFNRAHIGCSILSMSKRIMNEVMDTANENELPIFYQDTDSMHLYDDDVPKLKAAYDAKYGRELDGKALGQFHIDFELNGAAKKKDGAPEDAKIVATSSIFLGKKAYIDELQSVDKEGNAITGHHIRLKGVNNAAIREAKNEMGGAMELFKHLAKGEEFTAILNPTHHDNMMEHTATGVRNRKTGTFKRKLRF